jgi:periplasmic mercuric ion binding protein
MKFLLPCVVALLAIGSPVLAAEKMATLKVANMDCASCAPIVKRSLARVQGVAAVAVSVESGTALVTFDDERTNVAALTEATAKAGYPSRLMQ